MMIWTILLIKKNDNGWFINYIENKLINQIIKNNLQGKISVLVFEPNIQFNSEFVSVIDEQIDISDNFIIDIYSVINTHTCECVGLKGIVKVNEETLTFNNISKKDNEVILPITKLNPIKLNLISKNFTNIIYYINSQFLPNIAYAITHVSQPIVFLEKITKKIPISIIITAYKTQDYIEECLDSIENQTYFINNNDFEVLVGVDACEDTLNKLNQIKHKYRNLSIHMMSENKGTYITTNTLIDLVKYEDVIRFDSDDVMTPNLVNEVIKDKNDSDVVILGSVDYQNGKIGSKLLMTEGVIYFKKSIMDNIAGGYMPWRCSADTELIKRLVNKVKITQIKKALFYRRMHNQSLTQRPDTGYNSELRKEYKKQIKSFYNDDDIKIERAINKIAIINDNKITKSLINEKFPISIMITAYKTQDYIEDCLDSIENQTYFINNNDFEVLVGVDACEDTLNKLNQIKHKYRNLRIFMMSENKGTYITSNTLLDIVKYDNIIRFDSDDVMKYDMIEKISKYINNYDIIQFKFSDFIDDINITTNNFNYVVAGAIFYNRKVINIAGGYQPWICAADSEFIKRVMTKVKIKHLNERIFFRRKHTNSLTNNEQTNQNSIIRQAYIENIRIYNENEISKINKITTDYVEILNNKIDIIIPHCNIDDTRLRNLSYIIKYYKKYIPNSNIILVEQNTETNTDNIQKYIDIHLKIKLNEELFCKSYLLNEGFNVHKSDYLIFADSDCLPDKKILLNISKYFKDLDNNVIIPYNKNVINLNEKQTINLIKTDNFDFNSNFERRKYFSNGGVVLISSNNYYKIGGHDPRFIGWGGEDDAFFEKAKNLLGVIRLDYDLLHLNHLTNTNQNGKSNPNYQSNLKYYNEYLNFNNNLVVQKIGFEHLKNNKIKIKIFTNYQNNELLSLSQEFYKDLQFEKIAINGNKGFYGFNFFDHIINNYKYKDCDWIIYIDEDCFITDKKALLDLLYYQIINNIHCSGVPDGGVISHRFHNPISINPFFMIINVSEIRKEYNFKYVNSMKYENDLDKFIPYHLIKKNIIFNEKFDKIIHKNYEPYGIKFDNFEPYYKLFFWILRNNYKLLYLDAYDYMDDDFTTIIKNHEGIDFAYHTWFARKWNDLNERNRIIKIIEYCKKIKK